MYLFVDKVTHQYGQRKPHQHTGEEEQHRIEKRLPQYAVFGKTQQAKYRFEVFHTPHRRAESLSRHGALKSHEERVEVDVHVKDEEVNHRKRQKAEDEKSSAKNLFAFRVVDIIKFQLKNLPVYLMGTRYYLYPHLCHFRLLNSINCNIYFLRITATVYLPTVRQVACLLRRHRRTRLFARCRNY